MSAQIKKVIIENDEIKKIVDSCSKPETIEKNKEILVKAISGDDDISKDEIFELMIGMLAFSIKKEIPESEYKNIKITLTDEDKGSDYGSTKIDENDVTSILFSNYKCFESGDLMKIIAGLDSFGHELRHASQKKRIKNGEKSIRNFIISLEFGLATSSKQLYELLYPSLLSEVEAEVNGIETAAEFFKSLNPDFDCDRLIQLYMENSQFLIENYENGEYVYNRIIQLIKMSETIKILNHSNNNTKLFSESKLLNEFFDENGSFSFDIREDYDEFELLMDDSFKDISFNELMIPDEKMLEKTLSKILLQVSYSDVAFDELELYDEQNEEKKYIK